MPNPPPAQPPPAPSLTDRVPVPLRLMEEAVDHRVVSISLGSSSRNKSLVETFLGRRFAIERIGTDGDRERFADWITQLDGKVDAIGVGGTNLYVGAGGRRYAFREIVALIQGAKQTPVVDGYGLKEFLEPRMIHALQRDGVVDFQGKRCLMVMGVDRFGMAKALHEEGAQLLLADFEFALGMPIRFKSWKLHQVMANLLLPALVRLPFEWLYPTGSSEDVIQPKFGALYRWAELLAGDFLYIKRRLPLPEGRPLEGKIVITNTVTAEDVPLLRERGVKLLISSSPVLDGRSFGNNVLEAVVMTLAGKRPDAMTADDYDRILSAWDLKPRIERL